MSKITPEEVQRIKDVWAEKRDKANFSRMSFWRTWVPLPPTLDPEAPCGEIFEFALQVTGPPARLWKVVCRGVIVEQGNEVNQPIRARAS